MSELPLSEVIHASATRPGEVDYDVPFARCRLGCNCQVASDNAEQSGDRNGPDM